MPGKVLDILMRSCNGSVSQRFVLSLWFPYHTMMRRAEHMHRPQLAATSGKSILLPWTRLLLTSREADWPGRYNRSRLEIKMLPLNILSLPPVALLLFLISLIIVMVTS